MTSELIYRQCAQCLSVEVFDDPWGLCDRCYADHAEMCEICEMCDDLYYDDSKQDE